MKTFAFENEKGLRFKFNNYDDSLSYSLNGLGFSFDSNYAKLGEYFIANKKEFYQKTISFNCLFKNNENYRKLIHFISDSISLKIVYIDEKEYIIDIDIKDVSKKDIMTRDIVIATISCVNTSLFYDRKESIYELNVESNKNRWDFQWDLQFKDELSGAIELNVQGTTPSAFSLVVLGESINPSIKIIDKNNNETDINFNLTITANQKLLYSTVDNDLYIYVQNQDGSLKNAINSLDFKMNNFQKLQVGYNKIIATNINNATLTLFDSYTSI